MNRGRKGTSIAVSLPHSAMLQRPWGRSRLLACARYLPKQRFAVRWNIVAAPGNVLIRTDQGETCFISLVQSRILRNQYFERYVALRGGLREPIGGMFVALSDQEREPAPK